MRCLSQFRVYSRVALATTAKLFHVWIALSLALLSLVELLFAGSPHDGLRLRFGAVEPVQLVWLMIGSVAVLFLLVFVLRLHQRPVASAAECSFASEPEV